MSAFEIESFSYFQNKYMPHLKEPACVPLSLTQITSGWSQETFKSIMNKLSKNKTSPFPLYFTNTESMEQISQKRNILREIFVHMDSRGLKRIDATELYIIIMFLAKSDYQSFLKCIVDVFGLQNNGNINKGELFFFFDSMFRSFSKFLITKNDTKPSRINVRLDSNTLHKWVTLMFSSNQQFISKQDVGSHFEKVKDLNDFLKYIYLRMAATADWAKEEMIQNIKIEIEVKTVMRILLEEVDKALKAMEPVKA